MLCKDEGTLEEKKYTVSSDNCKIYFYQQKCKPVVFFLFWKKILACFIFYILYYLKKSLRCSTRFNFRTFKVLQFILSLTQILCSRHTVVINTQG